MKKMFQAWWHRVMASHGWRFHAGTSQTKTRKSTLLTVEELDARVLPSAQPNAAWLTPAEVKAVYGFNSVPSFTANKHTYAANGQGQTIAIVDVGGNANIVADLKTFSTQFKLPQMDGKNGDPTFKQLNESGGSSLPAPGSLIFEIDLDVEWAHAIAPDANIVLVEANSFSDADMKAAMSTADKTGASVVSLSLLLGDDLELAPPPNVTYVSCAGDAYGNQLGTAFGDSGVGSFDLTVGGTELSENGTQLTSNKNTYPGEQIWNQYAIDQSTWSIGGTAYNAGTTWGTYTNTPLPSWQTGAAADVGQQTGTTPTTRLSPDVSLVATNLAVVDSTDDGASTPWTAGWGTSFAAPMWAGLIAIANEGRTVEMPSRGTLNGIDPTLPLLYSLPSSDFHHVTSDPNSAYDQATGLGTPKANLIIPALVAPYKNYYSALNNKGQLTIYGNSTGTDNITLNEVYTTVGTNTGLFVQVQDNNATDLFPAGFVQSIVLNTRAKTDNVYVDATPSGVPLTINLGAGADSVTITGLGGSGNSGLGGTATVYGGTGKDVLTVNDPTPVNGGANYYVTDWSIQRSNGNTVNFDNLSQVTLEGVSPDAMGTAVSYEIGNTENGAVPTLKSKPGAATLTVDGGAGGGAFINFFTIGGQENYFAAKQTLNVSTGSNGENFVNVDTLPKGVALNISSAGTTDDYVFVGWGSEYSLTGIQGAINLTNTSGQTNLIVDGSGDAAANYTLTNSKLSVSNGPTITYQGDNSSSLLGVTSIEVIEGGANDCLNAESVPSDTKVSVHNDETSSPLIEGSAAKDIQVV